MWFHSFHFCRVILNTQFLVFFLSHNLPARLSSWVAFLKDDGSALIDAGNAVGPQLEALQSEFAS